MTQPKFKNNQCVRTTIHGDVNFYCFIVDIIPEKSATTIYSYDVSDIKTGITYNYLEHELEPIDMTKGTFKTGDKVLVPSGQIMIIEDTFYDDSLYMVTNPNDELDTEIYEAKQLRPYDEFKVGTIVNISESYIFGKVTAVQDTTVDILVNGETFRWFKKNLSSALDLVGEKFMVSRPTLNVCIVTEVGDQFTLLDVYEQEEFTMKYDELFPPCKLKVGELRALKDGEIVQILTVGMYGAIVWKTHSRGIDYYDEDENLLEFNHVMITKGVHKNKRGVILDKKLSDSKVIKVKLDTKVTTYVSGKELTAIIYDDYGYTAKIIGELIPFKTYPVIIKNQKYYFVTKNKLTAVTEYFTSPTTKTLKQCVSEYKPHLLLPETTNTTNQQVVV